VDLGWPADRRAAELEATILCHLDIHNEDPKPCTWTQERRPDHRQPGAVLSAHFRLRKRAAFAGGTRLSGYAEATNPPPGLPGREHEPKGQL
jgi:hypothetical protein